MSKAEKHLKDAASALADRASSRDTGAERSMNAAVHAFNVMFDTNLSVEQGWHFMVLLKMSRAKGGAFREDDYTDGAAYFALAGEEACIARAPKAARTVAASKDHSHETEGLIRRAEFFRKLIADSNLDGKDEAAIKQLVDETEAKAREIEELAIALDTPFIKAMTDANKFINGLTFHGTTIEDFEWLDEYQCYSDLDLRDHLETTLLQDGTSIEDYDLTLSRLKAVEIKIAFSNHVQKIRNSSDNEVQIKRGVAQVESRFESVLREFYDRSSVVSEGQDCE